MAVKTQGAPRDGARAPLPRWKKALIAGAAALVAIGIGLRAAGGNRDDPPPSAPAAADLGSSRVAPGTLVPGAGQSLSRNSSVGPRPSEKASGEEARRSITPSQPAEARRGFGIGSKTPGPPQGEARREGPTLAEKASPFFLRGGISFFIGLAAGVLARAVFKLALLVVGILVLGLGALSYSGVIPPVDWASIEDWMSARVEEAEESNGLRDHLLVHLPSAGLAGAGLVTGFKRK